MANEIILTAAQTKAKEALEASGFNGVWYSASDLGVRESVLVNLVDLGVCKSRTITQFTIPAKRGRPVGSRNRDTVEL